MRHHRIRRGLIFLLTALLVLQFPVTTAAETPLPPADYTLLPGIAQAPETEAPATILMDVDSGAILYARNAEETFFPASITKVMTALLVLEHCQPDEIVTFSYRATHELEEGSSSIARTDGEQLSVEECLYALLIASANEVAQALAEHVAGSIEAFADMMNEKARELGCLHTHFANPSGLNNPDHYTCCYDMALIFRAALQNPAFVRIDSTTSHYVPATNKNPERLGIAMKHKLLQKGDDHYPYALCGKTGYTSLAGYTLVTSARRDNTHLLCVCMNCKDSNSRYTTTRKLFDYGFDSFISLNIAENDTDFQVRCENIAAESFMGSGALNISLDETATVLLPADVSFKSLTGEYHWAENAEDSSYITYYYNGIPVGRAGLNISYDNTGNYDFLNEDTYVPPEVSEDPTNADGTAEGADAEPVPDSFWHSRTARILFAAACVLVVGGLVLFGLNYFNPRNRRLRRRRKEFRQKYSRKPRRR